jgi:hypothetical protein
MDHMNVNVTHLTMKELEDLVLARKLVWRFPAHHTMQLARILIPTNVYVALDIFGPERNVKGEEHFSLKTYI